MKWFEGNIEDAVTASKATNAIFVVYIEGRDEMSQAMSSALDSGGVSPDLSSSKFVCIKLAKDSESHKQFVEIYKIVPVPSLFFIGENGVPLEIVAGDSVPDNVAKKINGAISKIKGKPATVTPPANIFPPTISPSVSDTQVTLESSTPASLSKPKPTPENSLVATAPVEENSSASSDGKDKTAEMERVQELIKTKREESEKQEQQKERERELARRRMGKEIAEARRSQQDRELEEMRRERERDRKLEAEARERVLRQIQEDKANRAAKHQALSSAAPSSSVQPASPRPASPPSQANEARIQFKLPDGQTRTQSFPALTTLRELRSFIDTNIEIPFKEYTLATTFPRREFSSRDLNTSLADLQLLPSSVLLILPVQGNMSLMRGPGWTSTISAMLWALIQPVLDIGTYLRSLISGTRGRAPDPIPEEGEPEPESASTEQPEQPLQPSRQPYYNSLGGGKSVRKRGNVHTLSDGNDSNDENNTWNGNSTQLM